MLIRYSNSLHLYVTKTPQDDAAKSAQKVFYQEINFASITHFQSCKLQAKADRWIDETLQQDFVLFDELTAMVLRQSYVTQ